MSRRNKFLEKSLRRDEREARPEPKRQPRSRHDLSGQVQDALFVHTRTGRCMASVRHFFRNERGNVLLMPEPVARTGAEKLADKLASIKLTQLLRRRHQFAARAAGAKYKLAALSPNSQFRGPLQRLQDANLFALKAVNAELGARQLTSTNHQITAP